MNRRQFGSAAVGALAAPAFIAASAKPTQRVKEVRFAFEDHRYRTPYMFGGSIVDRVTLLNVRATVEDAAGRQAIGFGSMSLGNMWAFPSATHPYATTLEAMKRMAPIAQQEMAKLIDGSQPIAQGVELARRLLNRLPEVETELQLKQPIPKLAALVSLSAFDAALHDGFGRLLDRSSWATYGPSIQQQDLSAFLGPQYAGVYASRFVTAAPQDSVWVYHSVGASDPITPADVKSRPEDSLPYTLGEWAKYSGLSHFKIKLNGADIKADIERVMAIDATVRQSSSSKFWRYCVDFNERCPNEDALLEFLSEIKRRTPDGFAKIQYIEQPTKRDLKSDRQNTMHRAKLLRPIVIDESLTDVESLELSKEMGYTGVALKACKGQTQVLLSAAAAARTKMFLCVQDLTCPGASFLHSASIASHVKGVSAMEANGRQYVPSANRNWVGAYPGVFDVRNGRVNSAILNTPGLGVRQELIPAIG